MCGTGECGACTIILNGRAVPSCLVLAASVGGARIVTIEGISEDGKLHPLQQAFIHHHVNESESCTHGLILSAKAFLDQNPFTTREEIEEAFQGLLYNSTDEKKIIDAIMSVADG